VISITTIRELVEHEGLSLFFFVVLLLLLLLVQKAISPSTASLVNSRASQISATWNSQKGLAMHC
jgi:hypothetical protein